MATMTSTDDGGALERFDVISQMLDAEEAFSRAFKRAMGEPPARWRSRARSMADGS